MGSGETLQLILDFTKNKLNASNKCILIFQTDKNKITKNIFQEQSNTPIFTVTSYFKFLCVREHNNFAGNFVRIS